MSEVLLRLEPVEPLLELVLVALRRLRDRDLASLRSRISTLVTAPLRGPVVSRRRVVDLRALEMVVVGRRALETVVVEAAEVETLAQAVLAQAALAQVALAQVALAQVALGHPDLRALLDQQ